MEYEDLSKLCLEIAENHSCSELIRDDESESEYPEGYVFDDDTEDKLEIACVFKKDDLTALSVKQGGRLVYDVRIKDLPYDKKRDVLNYYSVNTYEPGKWEERIKSIRDKI